MLPRVLFVSKPIAPPFHDGTKCLVRDVARHLERTRAVVMSSRGAPALAAAVESVPVYSSSGRFAPGLGQNLRAALWLAARSRADVWHFVFAPNPRSSAIGRALSRARRVPVVQTVASPPRSFDKVGRLLFGDIVVAQSRWTEERIRDAGYRDRIEVVPPPLGDIAERDREARRALRARMRIPESAPIVVYPGDIETSGGAEAVARAVGPLTEAEPELVVVFAFRAKTPRAEVVAKELAGQLDPARVRFESELADVLVLISESSVVLFPVDDLWGKVDLPIVLLESMALGVPVVALDHGPLRDLDGTVRVPKGDDRALVAETLALLRERDYRERVTAAQRESIRRRHRAEVVARAYEDLYLELCKR